MLRTALRLPSPQHLACALCGLRPLRMAAASAWAATRALCLRPLLHARAKLRHALAGSAAGGMCAARERLPVRKAIEASSLSWLVHLVPQST